MAEPGARATARRRPVAALEGPVLLLWAAGLVAAEVAATIAFHGSGEAGVRAAIRATARSSLAFFLAAFVASPLRRTWRTPFTAWLLRNRRWVGLSLVVSHAVHLGAIVTLASRWPAAGEGIDVGTRVGGTLGYAVLAVLAFTSNDRAVARLGPRRWRAVHRTGMWLLWGVFLASYGFGAWRAPGHAAATAILLGAAALRTATLARATPGAQGATRRSEPSSSASTGQ